MQGEIGQIEDAFQLGHLVRIDDVDDVIAYKKQPRLRVVDDVVYLLVVELVKDGYYHGSVGQRGQECYRPVC